MKTVSVSADRFKAIVDAYGADPDRWPQAERDGALRFMTEDSRAEAWLDEACAVDALLSSGFEAGDAEAPGAEADEAQHARVLAYMLMNPATNIVAFPRRQAASPSRRRILPLIWTGIGLAACLAGATVGIKIGLSSMDDVRAQSVLDLAQLDAEN